MLSTSGGEPIYDLWKSRWALFYSVFVAIFFAFLYIKFMDWCAVQCAWISVITVQLGLAGGGVLCYFVRDDLLKKENILRGSNGEHWLIAGIVIFGTLGLIYFLCLICNLKSLRVSIRIIETAADFFADTKRVALVPVFFFIFSIGLTFAWLYGFICVSSIGTISVSSFEFQTKQIEHVDGVRPM